MCCDGRVVKASDSKSDGVTRTGSNPVLSDFLLIFINSYYYGKNALYEIFFNLYKTRFIKILFLHK